MGYFESIIDEIIEKRRRRMSVGSEQPSDLLSLLLRALDPSIGELMSLDEVRSNILTFLSAGHETTANTLAWSIFLLSQSPEWSAHVQEEAERELDGPVNGLAERLIATRAVVEEALRLYPPIAAISRTAHRADTLGDLYVKSGSLVVIAPYVLHRHWRLWERPDVFDPARFLPEARSAIPRFAYLPFGVGPRTCIGASFALQEATIVLAVLIRRFDLQLMPNARVWPVQKITLRPATGLPMRVASRAAKQARLSSPRCGMNSKGSPAGGEPLRRRIFCARRLDYACTKMLDSSFALDRIGGFSRKLQYARVLISYQQIEENPGPVRKAERVMVLRLALKVYFAELCHTERHGIRPEPFPAISDIFLESELRSRKKAHGNVHLCRVGKTACAGSPKISRYKSFAQLGGARRHSVQTIVAHASSYCWTQLPS